MEIKTNDKVKVTDGSYSFGILNGQYVESIVFGYRGHLTVIATGLLTMGDYRKDTEGEYRAVNDLLVTDGNGNFWFTQSRLVNKIEKEKKIEVRYYCDGLDITNQVSNETKRNLASDC